MDDAVNLTLALAGYLYFGSLSQWWEYAHVLTAGKVGAYKRSTAYRNQSLTEFFRLFRSLWNINESPPPSPETFGLLPVQPVSYTQDEIIDALLDRNEDAGSYNLALHHPELAA